MISKKNTLAEKEFENLLLKSEISKGVHLARKRNLQNYALINANLENSQLYI